jgi:hypothetical protein
VFGGRSRFMTDKVLKVMEPAVYQAAQFGQTVALDSANATTLDVSARLKAMW